MGYRWLSGIKNDFILKFSQRKKELRKNTFGKQLRKYSKKTRISNHIRISISFLPRLEIWYMNETSFYVNINLRREN